MKQLTSIHLAMMSKSILICVMVVMTTVVHYSCGQCTTKYCEEGDTTVVYQNLMEQNNYLLQEIKKNGEEVKVIKEDVRKYAEEVKGLGNKIDNITLGASSTTTPSANGVCTNDSNLIHSNSSWKHCGDVYKAGYNQSGVYTLKPLFSPKLANVYCDHSNGGGWTVFQRRLDGRVLFNRTWKGYKHGFGDLQTEHWLGNDLLAYMTSSPAMTLRVDMMDFNGDTAYAEYKDFRVLSEPDNYKLEIGTYSGTAGNSLSHNNNMQFSTIDRDNDQLSLHCATRVDQGGDGGWWYGSCTNVNLNGYYKHHIPAGSGRRPYIFWLAWKRTYENLQRTTMRFRPSNF